MIELRMQIPEGALAALRKDPAEFTRELRVAAAVTWYEHRMVSQGRAAEIAGMSRAEFILELTRYGVSPFQESLEELTER